MKKYNWVAQSAHGAIVLSVSKPKVVNQIGSWVYDTNDFVIVGIGRRNHRWKDSLIDLSKNDYIIKDGILMATRKHAALIHAWADGAVIQYQDPMLGWCDYEDDEVPRFTDKCNLRIKPATRTVKFRNYISRSDRTIKVACDGVPSDLYEWIDKEWREVEIEL